MRTTFQGVLESLLGIGLVLAGLGGLVAGGAYVWRKPQTPAVIRAQPLRSEAFPQRVQPPQQALPTAIVPTLLNPTPAAPEVARVVQAPAQPNQPAPTPEAQANADATAVAADATAVALVQCQTPNTWFLPTGASGRPRITARFGKQAEGSPYVLALMQNGVVPTDTEAIFHPGLDFGVDANTPLFAVADGEVISTAYSDLYGKHVRMKTREGEVLYAHLNEVFVQAGDTVTCSQPIGLSGATGKALTGAHLHLELRNNGKPVDPMPLVKRSLAADKPDWLR